MKRKLAIVVVALFCLSVPAGAFAAEEKSLMVGAAATFGLDSDFGIGARVEYPLESLLPNLSIAGSFSYFFPGDFDSWWEINANALYGFDVNETFTPYVGAGINYSSWEAWIFSDTAISMNVIGGCKFNLGLVVTPFTEVRIGIGDNDQLEISGGVPFAF